MRAVLGGDDTHRHAAVNVEAAENEWHARPAADGAEQVRRQHGAEPRSAQNPCRPRKWKVPRPHHELADEIDARVKVQLAVPGKVELLQPPTDRYRGAQRGRVDNVVGRKLEAPQRAARVCLDGTKMR